jgi:hypothetical protein
LGVLAAFSEVVRRLQNRPHARVPLLIEDEYDMQYILGALLAVRFSDIRPEEHAPSMAGASPRLDFLLHDEQIVIESKFVRQGMTDKQLCDELLVDIARYGEHPRCGTLVCFAYDPQRRLKNPAGIRRDLERTASKMPVRVIIL